MKRKIKTALLLTTLLSLFISVSAFAATIKYTYDNLNRLINVERSDGIRVAYTYDDVGNRTRMVRTVLTPAHYVYVSSDGVCDEKTPCYNLIQNAVNGAVTGTIIRIKGETYSESITLNEAKSLTLQGGWNSSFSSQTEKTTLKKAPKAPQGSLTMQALTIKP